MKTIEEIKDLINRVCAANLSGTELFAIYDAKAVQMAYNGIGPDSFPEEVRERISRFLDLFEPAALIHDLRFDESNGSRFDFNLANMEFHENCLRLAAQKYPWWRHPLRRFAAREVSHILYAAVRSPAGWSAWTEAREKQLAKR